MSPTHSERRKEVAAKRRTFGELAKVALNLRMREARGPEVRWNVEQNTAWVSWPREDGRHAYASLHRKLAMITGELGASTEPVDMAALPMVTSLVEATPAGCRISIGLLLHGHATAWSSGGSEAALIDRLDWIARQLQLRLHAFMSATRPQP